MTLVVAMAPVIELRGAIPIATAHGLDAAIAIPVAVVGNLIPVPFIILFIRRVFDWMEKNLPRLGGLVTALRTRADKKADVVLKYAFWGLVILVAIPLPGTGAWTGALVAAMLDMPMKKSLPTIILGVLIAGFIMSAITYGLPALLAL